MTLLSDQELNAYLEPMSEEQSASIRAVRKLLIELAPDLTEEIDAGKWFGGLLTYHTDDRIFMFALGPLSAGYTTFHMMPFYGSKTLQESYGPALKKLLSGKSCIKFKQYSDVPEDALCGIIGSTPNFAEIARVMFAKRKR
jgi:hypothetical protein